MTSLGAKTDHMGLSDGPDNVDGNVINRTAVHVLIRNTYFSTQVEILANFDVVNKSVIHCKL